MSNRAIRPNDRVHRRLRSGRRGVRDRKRFPGTLDEAIQAAMERTVWKRDRLVIRDKLFPRRLTWNRIGELAARPDLPMMIRSQPSPGARDRRSRR